MKYRPLGKTGINVSEIGFGAWGIGSWSSGQLSYGVTDDTQSKNALARAFDAGITFYDTSSLYGLGHSEELIGEVFKDRRDEVIIATKTGYSSYDEPADFSPAAIRDSVDRSLRRLRCDYIDLLQLHNPPAALLCSNPSIMETLRALRRDGKVRAFGVSLKTPDEAVAAIKEHGFPVVQINLNMMDLRALDAGVLDLASEHAAGVIVRTPLSFGFLTGKIAADAVFPEGDHRRRWSSDQVGLWAVGGRRLLHIARESGVQTDEPTDSQIALQFCLSFPETTTVIPGMLSVEEVTENAAASDLGPLDKIRLEAVLSCSRETDFSVRKSA